ncbi:4554_t:CDS:2, partial [Gigaspora margarita]
RLIKYCSNMRYWTIDREEEEIIEKECTELVIKKDANGKKYGKKVQESMFGITKQEKIQTRLEMIRGAINIIRDLVNLVQSRFIEHIWKFRCELTAEWKVKEGIAKNNKRKPQTAEEISDPKSTKKQKGNEKQIIQLETNSIDPQLEQRTHKVKRRVNKENQDPLREGSKTRKRKKDKKKETKEEIAKYT